MCSSDLIIPTKYLETRLLQRSEFNKLNEQFSGLVTPSIRDTEAFVLASKYSLSIFNIKNYLKKLDEDDPDINEKIIESGNMVGLSFENKACDEILSLTKNLIYSLRDNENEHT